MYYPNIELADKDFKIVVINMLKIEEKINKMNEKWRIAT